MSCGEITFYQSRDNWQILGLSEGGEILSSANLSAITRVLLVIEGISTIDSSTAPTVFNWPLSGGIGVNLANAVGLALFSARPARLIVYDASHTNGLVWADDLVMTFKA